MSSKPSGAQQHTGNEDAMFRLERLQMIFNGILAICAVIALFVGGFQLSAMRTQSNLMDGQLGAMREQNNRMIEQTKTMIDQSKAAWQQVDQTKAAIEAANAANRLAEKSAKDTLAKMEAAIGVAEAANTLAKENAAETLKRADTANETSKQSIVDAKKASADTLKEAKAANAISQTTANEQLRAYISVVMNPRPLFFRPQNGAPFEMRMRMVNAGPTPAKNVVVRTETYYRQNEAGLDPTKLGPLNGAGMTVGPGSEFPLFLPHKNKPEDEANGTPCVLGRIEYTDVFGRPHYTNFFLFLGPPASDGRGFEPVYANSWNDSN